MLKLVMTSVASPTEIIVPQSLETASRWARTTSCLGTPRAAAASNSSRARLSERLRGQGRGLAAQSSVDDAERAASLAVGHPDDDDAGSGGYGPRDEGSHAERLIIGVGGVKDLDGASARLWSRQGSRRVPGPGDALVGPHHRRHLLDLESDATVGISDHVGARLCPVRRLRPPMTARGGGRRRPLGSRGWTARRRAACRSRARGARTASWSGTARTIPRSWPSRGACRAGSQQDTDRRHGGDGAPVPSTHDLSITQHSGCDLHERASLVPEPELSVSA